MTTDKRHELETMYQRRAQSQQDSQRRQAKEKRLDEVIAELERELGIEPAKLSVWERLAKRIKGER